VSDDGQSIAASFGGAVVGAMLGAAVHAAIAVIVPKIPSVTRSDQLTTAPAAHVAGLDERPVLFTQRPMIGPVSAFGGGATTTPVDPPAVGTPTAPMISETMGRTPRAAGS
jgi:hypothetical protein